MEQSGFWFKRDIHYRAKSLALCTDAGFKAPISHRSAQSAAFQEISYQFMFTKPDRNPLLLLVTENSQ